MLNGAGAVQIWNLDRDVEPTTFPLKHNWLTSVTFSPSGRILAAGVKGWKGQGCCVGRIKLLDVGTGSEALTLEGYSDDLKVAFSPDGRILAWGGTEDAIRFRDVVSGRNGAPSVTPITQFSLAFFPLALTGELLRLQQVSTSNSLMWRVAAN